MGVNLSFTVGDRARHGVVLLGALESSGELYWSGDSTLLAENGREEIAVALERLAAVLRSGAAVCGSVSDAGG
ncbi:MAG: hypothetical protein NVSMB64_13510 [Candidatus Velthaea sp.]